MGENWSRPFTYYYKEYPVTVYCKSNFWELDSLTNNCDKKVEFFNSDFEKSFTCLSKIWLSFTTRDNSTNFPVSLLIGPTWAYFSLDFYLNNTDTQALEFCHDIRVLLTAKNADRIGIHQSFLFDHLFGLNCKFTQLCHRLIIIGILFTCKLPVV